MIQVGSVHEETFLFTQEDVNLFARVSGDINPLHIDPEYSAQTIFKKPIIHGFLGGSIFSKMIGTTLPGKGTIYLKQSLSFKKPMFVEHTYSAIVKVVKIYPETHRALLSTIILNEDKEEVISGEALVLNPGII